MFTVLKNFISYNHKYPFFVRDMATFRVIVTNKVAKTM